MRLVPPSDSPPIAPPDPPDAEQEAFHAGAPACMERCYLEHFDTVDRAVGAVLHGPDREDVVHEVFFRLLSDEGLRRGFRGGSLGAWLRVVARNQAIDYTRRRRPEVALPDDSRGGEELRSDARLEERTDVRLTLQRFGTEVLPAKWRRVFVARFVDGDDQKTAARALGMRRTTLAYQEYRIRTLLRRFMLRGEPG
jgi:RNA polymerase sigma-70 factor, ECF subfamily